MTLLRGNDFVPGVRRSGTLFAAFMATGTRQAARAADARCILCASHTEQLGRSHLHGSPLFEPPTTATMMLHSSVGVQLAPFLRVR